MSEKNSAGVPFVGDDEDEQQLWNDLAQLPPVEPSPRLRQRFYAAIDRTAQPTLLDRWRQWLGLQGVAGLLTAMSCLVVGVIVGLTFRHSTIAGQPQLAGLQQQVATLNRNLILDRLASDSASKRLLGVIEATGMAENDAEVAHALLARAVDDRVYSVRSAAIDAIGPRLNTPAVGDELMASLEKAESPLVQLALVDLVLRHGNAGQLERLLDLSEQGILHPDVAAHVKASVRRNQV